MNFEMWFFRSTADWFNSWGLVYPGVWIFFFFWIFAFGACIGSFLNVCIWRIPRSESLSKACSHCTVCGAKIRWYDNIPVASYLILRGRCRHCRTPYSSSYFFVELICGLLVTALWAKTGLCRQMPEIIPARMLLIFFGMACAVTDMRFRVVPDKLTFTGMIFALLTAALLPAAWGVEKSWEAALQSLAQGLLPAVFLAIFAELGKLVSRQEVIGWGDIKFTALCGMLIGLPGTVFALFAGSLTGSLWGVAVERKMSAKVPFVPFIMCGALIWIFFDQQILGFYVKFFTGM